MEFDKALKSNIKKAQNGILKIGMLIICGAIFMT